MSQSLEEIKSDVSKEDVLTPYLVKKEELTDHEVRQLIKGEVPKPKRKLSERQLEVLKKGRELRWTKKKNPPQSEPGQQSPVHQSEQKKEPSSPTISDDEVTRKRTLAVQRLIASKEKK